jgi:hypothetical protein
VFATFATGIPTLPTFATIVGLVFEQEIVAITVAIAIAVVAIATAVVAIVVVAWRVGLEG